MDFPQALAEIGALVDGALAKRLAAVDAPARLGQAMRHAVLSGGKRLRPFLLIHSAALFGVTQSQALPAACAVELVHCYSLVHDDLPAMDDDDLRRGRPTVHVAFDEATAILAGDALLTLAFEILTSSDCATDPAMAMHLVSAMAGAAGAGGMVGGQSLDLAFENTQASADDIAQMQNLKTGALFGFACQAGALLGAGTRADAERLGQFAEHFGHAFQITDDLLDVVSTPARAGKRTAKDARRGKATQVARQGVVRAKAAAEHAVELALAAVADYADKAAPLRQAATYLLTRQA
ncbi:MAG: polyprenyl synthetase family protein [Alphaproteobacteria bacterium]